VKRTLVLLAVIALLLAVAWLVSMPAEPASRDQFIRDCGGEYSAVKCKALWDSRGAK
jgi:hypothetical protein